MPLSPRLATGLDPVVACLLPANASETTLAAQYVAANAQAIECLRLAQDPNMAPAFAQKYRAQAATMMRQSQGAMRLLLRVQMAPNELWSFPPTPGSRIARTVRVKPRLMVNADEAAVNAAVAGEGVVRIISYKIDREVREGRLVVLLPDDELPRLPVHLIVPEGRLAVAKVRAFVDFTRPRLKSEFASMARPWP